MAVILGSEMFIRRGSFTSGVNLFMTESGLAGNSGEPVQLFDVVIIVDQASDLFRTIRQYERLANT
jgi:hypothetical protein